MQLLIIFTSPYCHVFRHVLMGWVLFFSVVGLSSPVLAQIINGLPLEKTTLTLKAPHQKAINISAEIANTPDLRERGLMFRRMMPDNAGMIFVFPHDLIACFWMKNTPIPLTALFITADGRMTNAADMQPYSEQSHCATEPVRFVLEVNQGFLKRHRLATASHSIRLTGMEKLVGQ